MKNTYIAPNSKVIKLDKLMDHGENIPSASQGEDNVVDAKRMSWDIKKQHKPVLDNGYDDLWDNDKWDTNLWDDAGWK